MKKLIQLVIAFSCLLLLSGCDQPANSVGLSDAQSNDAVAQTPPGVPSDYFPTDVGHKWSYKIELNEGHDALHHSVKCLAKFATETRGRYLLFGEKKKIKDDLHLVLKVKSKALKQGPLQYPDGCELIAERDDLGIFEWSEKIYWAIYNTDGYGVMWVVTYSPESPGLLNSGGPWGSYGVEPAYAMRHAFFADRPGIEMSLENENDKLLFSGPSNYGGKPALLFVRTVTARELKDGEKMESLERGFTEELTFVRGIGLVKLVQRVGDEVTMTWTLE